MGRPGTNVERTEGYQAAADRRTPANRRDALLDVAERHAASIGVDGDSYAELLVATALTPGGAARTVVALRFDAAFRGISPAGTGAA